jgi:hypothetical protein
VTLIDRCHGPVASWCGSLPGTSSHDAQEDTMRLADLLQRVAVILHRDGLLRACRVELDGWFDIDTQLAAPRPCAMRNLDPAESVVEACKQMLSRLDEGGKLAARDIAVFGSGAVDDGAGHAEVQDLIWIAGTLTGAYSLWIHTQSDAWMTHALDGAAQPARCAHNAPRLERALTTICAELGIVLEGERVTDFSLIEGFQVKNFTDGNGEVIVPERLRGIAGRT